MLPHAAYRRHAFVFVGCVEVRDAVFGDERGRDVRRPLLRGEVVHRPLRAERPEPVTVEGGQPGGHEAAVRTAEHADAIGVAEVVAVECRVDDRQHVVDVDAAPAGTRLDRVARAVDRLAPAGVPSAPATRVAEHDHEAGRCLHLELVEEVLAVLGERAAVDVEQHGVAEGLVEVGGPHDPGVDLVGAVGRASGEVLPTEQLSRELGTDVGAALVADVQLGELRDRAPGSGDDRCRGVERRDRQRSVGHRGRHERAVRRQPVEVRRLLDPRPWPAVACPTPRPVPVHPTRSRTCGRNRRRSSGSPTPERSRCRSAGCRPWRSAVMVRCRRSR